MPVPVQQLDTDDIGTVKMAMTLSADVSRVLVRR